MKNFKIGERVKVVKKDCNASQFNPKNNLLGVYANKDWADLVFTIYGEYNPVNYETNPDIYGAYPLALEGRFVGYVYNDAIELDNSVRIDLNDEVKCILTDEGAKFLNHLNTLSRETATKESYIPKFILDESFPINYSKGDVYKAPLWKLFRIFNGYSGTEKQFLNLELA